MFKRMRGALALLMLGCMLLCSGTGALAAVYEPTVTLTEASGISRTGAQLNAYVSCARLQKYDSVGFYLSNNKSSINSQRYTLDFTPKTASFMLSVSAAKLKSYCGTLTAGSIYYYKMFVVVGGEEYASSIGWFRTTDNENNINKGEPTFVLYDAGEITMDGAVLRCDVTANPIGLSFTRVGLLMGTARNAMSEVTGGTPNSYSLPRMIYQVNSYRRLAPLTTYYYQFYAQTKAGASYVSGIKSFTTLAPYHTVSFQPNGGFLNQMNAVVVYPGQPYTFYETPVRQGYSFTGWYTLPLGGSLVPNSGIWNYDADVTLYAQWTQGNIPVAGGELRVFFDVDHDNLGANESKTVKVGKKYGTLPEPSRTGYKFAGWYTAQRNRTRVKSSTVVSTAGTQTLYAGWSPRSYEVRFKGNGGSVTPSKTNLEYGTVYTLPTAVREGYVFAGWNTAKDGSGTTIVSGSPWSFTSKVTLYAMWSQGYPATNPAGGTLPNGTTPMG